MLLLKLERVLFFSTMLFSFKLCAASHRIDESLISFTYGRTIFMLIFDMFILKRACGYFTRTEPHWRCFYMLCFKANSTLRVPILSRPQATAHWRVVEATRPFPCHSKCYKEKFINNSTAIFIIEIIEMSSISKQTNPNCWLPSFDNTFTNKNSIAVGSFLCFRSGVPDTKVPAVPIICKYMHYKTYEQIQHYLLRLLLRKPFKLENFDTYLTECM